MDILKNVKHPSHYIRGGLECIQVIKAAVMGLTGFEAVCTSQVIKYIWRWKFKNGREDVAKCVEYGTYLLEYLDAQAEKDKKNNQ